MLGLCNVLLLNNDIRVNQSITRIKFSDLTHCLKDHLTKLFEVNISSKSTVDETQMANAIQNIEDCVKLFPKLEQGLDINIKFSDVTDFEFTPAIAMFDSYNIRLLHGWVVDPQQIQLYHLIKDKSYNEIVDFLTSENDSKWDDEQIAKREQEKTIIRQFLNQYQQQLTAQGLIRMHEVMNDNEIAIFFRNNHFSAVYKRSGRIWELVTDQGIVDADGRITWQSLSQLSGDEQFVSNKFNLISQNRNQQVQIESYNNALKQQQQQQPQQQHNNDDDDDDDDDANNNNNNDNNTINNNQDENINQDDENKKAIDLDDEMAQRLALEQQLGLKSGELEKLEQQQKEAMQQLEQQKSRQENQQKIYSNYNNNNNNNNNNNAYNTYNTYNNQQQYVYANAYNNNYNNYNNYNNGRKLSRKERKRRNRANKDGDDCVIL